jgi:phosphopantetheine adenylyltransferase
MNYEERSEYMSSYVAKVVNARTVAEDAQKNALDAASEFGYEMGVMSEKFRINEEITDIFDSLTDEEEDAKLTLEIVRQIVSRADDLEDV